MTPATYNQDKGSGRSVHAAVRPFVRSGRRRGVAERMSHGPSDRGRRLDAARLARGGRRGIPRACATMMRRTDPHPASSNCSGASAGAARRLPRVDGLGAPGRGGRRPGDRRASRNRCGSAVRRAVSAASRLHSDPPPVLWAQGRFEALARPAVAVIGSRAATPYALQVGTRIAAELAERGIVVVSGLARGVDSAAHRGCLEGGGATAAVLGCGLDRVYPPEHADLASEIADRAFCSRSWRPGRRRLPEHFPLRNRIISGLSLATVVVEASEHSGSLITARCALEQGRDVMAVPGSVLTRPEPRLARAPEGWRQDRRDGGRHPERAGVAGGRDRRGRSS